LQPDFVNRLNGERFIHRFPSEFKVIHGQLLTTRKQSDSIRRVTQKPHPEKPFGQRSVATLIGVRNIVAAISARECGSVPPIESGS
jgi:hypothetical protein